MIMVLVAMFVLSVPLSFVVIAVVPVMAVLTGIIGKKIRGAFRKNQEWVGRLTSNIEESVSGVKVTKTFRREEAEFARFEKVNHESQKVGIEAELISYAFIPLMSIMTSLTLGLIVGVGGYMALGGTGAQAGDGVSIGLLTAFILYSQRFFEPLRQITQVYSMLQSALAGAERLFEPKAYTAFTLDYDAMVARLAKFQKQSMRGYCPPTLKHHRANLCCHHRQSCHANLCDCLCPYSTCTPCHMADQSPAHQPTTTQLPQGNHRDTASPNHHQNKV